MQGSMAKGRCVIIAALRPPNKRMAFVVVIVDHADLFVSMHDIQRTVCMCRYVLDFG